MRFLQTCLAGLVMFIGCSLCFLSDLLDSDKTFDEMMSDNFYEMEAWLVYVNWRKP